MLINIKQLTIKKTIKRCVNFNPIHTRININEFTPLSALTCYLWWMYPKGSNLGICTFIYGDLIPWGGNGHPPQYSCLKNPRDRRAWILECSHIFQRVTKSQPWLSAHAMPCRTGRLCGIISLWYLFHNGIS